MKRSNFLLPLMRETPSEANCVSHQLMLKCGMIKQTSSGIYSWLPYGLAALKKIENEIRKEMKLIDCNEMLMSTIQNADIWKKSERYNDGPEMLKFRDRNDKELLYGPTNEEMITDIMKNYILSYKNLPRSVYQVQWKFRDEIRPKLGVMRGREFLMKDAYSFDLDYESAKDTYYDFFISYLRIFDQLGLKVIPMQAASGPIGGELSHEFILVTDTGESEIIFDKSLLEYDVTLVDHDKTIDYYNNKTAFTIENAKE